METIAQEYSLQPEVFRATAKRWTEEHAAPKEPNPRKRKAEGVDDNDRRWEKIKDEDDLIRPS